MKNEELLDEVISERLKGLKTMAEGSEQFDTEVSGLSKLMTQRNEMEKIKNERIKLDNEYASITVENDRVQSENSDRKMRNIIAGAGLGITSGLAIATMIIEGKGVLFGNDSSRKIMDRIFKFKN